MRNLLFVASLALLPAAAWPQDRTFQSGYTGSVPADTTLRTQTYFEHPAVRALVYELEDGPLPRARVEAALDGTGISTEDLRRVKLLREEDGRFFIAFNYFTADDMRAIHAATEARVPSLVQAYLARKDDFRRIFDRYPVPTVSRDRLAFVLVGGFGLNWEGLAITAQHGWRKPVSVTGRLPSGEEWRYSFWASEEVAEHSARGFYWGSTTFPGGPFNYAEDPVDFAFSSFGDPYSDPRMSFPDLLYLPGEAMAPPVRAIARRIGLADGTALGQALHNALGLELGRSVGPMLFALRQGPRSGAALGEAALEKHRAVVPDILDLLEETGYVTHDAGMYRLRYPALDYDDAELVREALALNEQILTAWLSEQMDGLRTELRDLTSLRHGVPFESLFTQIWHEMFGLTTRELVAAGFMADPRAEGVAYQGSFPAVWRLPLYDYQPD
jgi:hypothetical protein